MKLVKFMLLGILAGALAGCRSTKVEEAPAVVVAGHGKAAFTVGEKLYETDFSSSEGWVVQVEQKGEPGKEWIRFGDHMLDLCMPARGCTAWLTKKFQGPIAIVYQVKCPLEWIDGDAIQARDINNFWHCSHPGDAEKIFDAELYHGGFGSYSKMQGYYASTGGGAHEGNHTTRFRRYPREVDGKPYPHIALNDRDDQEGYLITPGAWHTVQLVACNGLVQYIVDGKVVYEIKEGDSIDIETPDKGKVTKPYSLKEFPAYVEGYFGFRLVRTHHQYRNLKIYRLDPK
ncbi:hypothetical protein PDESU_05139 [Pontiella desulfatans]|uniref:DUF6250 domain-containing protein n=1 Tax=Pontiella desulfatans TaxID=2750659 RepID=A0A6C2U8W3_PONDE|nr:DUF6250 domain-containing protein [Pontiella desulfatans]VGO16548.1 hypothetical protein PDESU_05139 [Pontiella desulfatans]